MQILASDGSDRLVLGHSRVGILRAVGQLRGLAARDAIDVIVAAGDGVEIFLLRQVKLVGAEFRPAQQVVEDFEHVVKIGLQAGQRDGCGIGVAVGLDFGGADFEVVIQLVAGLGLGAAGAPDFAVHVDQAGLCRRVRNGSRRECGPCRQSEAVRGPLAGR